MRTWLTTVLVMVSIGLLTTQPAEAQSPQNHVWLRENVGFIYQAKPLAESGEYAYPAWPRLIARAFGIDFRFLMHCNNHIRNSHKPLPINAIIFLPKRRALASRFIDCFDIKSLTTRNQILAMIEAASQYRLIPVSEFLGVSVTKSAFGKKTSHNVSQQRNSPPESSNTQTPWLILITQKIVDNYQLTVLAILFFLVLVYTAVTAARILELLINERRLVRFEKRYGQDIAEIIENHGYEIKELIPSSITKRVLAIEAVPVPNVPYGDNGDREEIVDIEDRIARVISARIPIGQRIRFKFRRQRE